MEKLLMQWSFDVGIRLRWFIMTTAAVASVVTLHFTVPRANRSFWLQLGHLAFLTFVLVALLFCATESDAFYNPSLRLQPVTKKLLLAGATGILAQLAIWLNRIAHGGMHSRHRVWAIYIDTLMGFLTGMLGAVVFIASHTSFASVADEQAIMGGAVGGALGTNLFDLLTFRIAPNTEAAISGSERAGRAAAHTPHTCFYAGQIYSAGAKLQMPGDHGFPVVRQCEGRTGQWVDAAEPAAAGLALPEPPDRAAART